jgi:hypothetical protein
MTSFPAAVPHASPLGDMARALAAGLVRPPDHTLRAHVTSLLEPLRAAFAEHPQRDRGRSGHLRQCGVRRAPARQHCRLSGGRTLRTRLRDGVAGAGRGPCRSGRRGAAGPRPQGARWTCTATASTTPTWSTRRTPQTSAVSEPAGAAGLPRTARPGPVFLALAPLARLAWGRALMSGHPSPLRSLALPTRVGIAGRALSPTTRVGGYPTTRGGRRDHDCRLRSPDGWGGGAT